MILMSISSSMAKTPICLNYLGEWPLFPSNIRFRRGFVKMFFRAVPGGTIDGNLRGDLWDVSRLGGRVGAGALSEDTDRRGNIRRTEDEVSGDQHIRSCLHNPACCVSVNPAINLHMDLMPG